MLVSMPWPERLIVKSYRCLSRPAPPCLAGALAVDRLHQALTRGLRLPALSPFFAVPPLIIILPSLVAVRPMNESAARAAHEPVHRTGKRGL